MFGIFCNHVSTAEHGKNMVKSVLKKLYIEVWRLKMLIF